MISVYASVKGAIESTQGLPIPVSTLEDRTLYVLVELAAPVFNGRTTCMLSSVHDVTELVNFCTEHEYLVASARVMTPGEMNKTGVWTLDELAAIWEAEEPESPRYKALVYETASGKHYAHSQFNTSLAELGGLSCLVEFPVGPFSSGGRDSRVLRMPSTNRAGVVPLKGKGNL
jgi:hypothetical protein